MRFGAVSPRSAAACLGVVEQLAGDLGDARAKGVDGAAGEPGLHQLAQPRVVGWIEGQQRPGEREELLRLFREGGALLGGERLERIDREAIVVEQGRHAVVVASGQPDLGRERRAGGGVPFRLGLRLVIAEVAKAGARHGAGLPQVGVEGVGAGHKLRVHQIEQHRVRDAASRLARVWLGQRAGPDHRLVGHQRSDRSWVNVAATGSRKRRSVHEGRDRARWRGRVAHHGPSPFSQPEESPTVNAETLVAWS